MALHRPRCDAMYSAVYAVEKCQSRPEKTTAGKQAKWC